MNADKGTCAHELFHANVNVIRMPDVGRFNAEVRIKCARCGVPMRFIGLPAGLDLNGACVSVDGEEARLAIAPRGEVVTILEESTPASFTVRRRDTEERRCD